MKTTTGFAPIKRARAGIGKIAVMGAVSALAAFWLGSPAQAQDWPKAPVKMVVAATPGSAPDIIARILSERLSPLWKHPVIVENRQGAGGLIAMRATASSPADGHTLVLAHAAAAVITPYTYRSAKYDIDKDFTTIASIGYTPMGMIASLNSPAKNLADVIELSKKEPGKQVLGNPTLTSIPHLAGELLNQQGGAKLFNVTMGGAANGQKAVISGDAPYYIDGVAPLLPMIRANRVRPIAVFADKELDGLEGIPLAKDTVPGLVLTGWFVLAGPAGIPKPVVAKINEDINRVLAMPEVIAKFREFGTYTQPGSVAEAQAFMKSEKARWSQVLRTAGIQAQ